VHIHESQEDEFQTELKRLDWDDVGILRHQISHDKYVPFGALRYDGMEQALRRMKKNQACFILDDDWDYCTRAYGTRTNKDGEKVQCYPQFRSYSVLSKELERLITAAEIMRYLYFTVSMNGNEHNSYDPLHPLRGAPSWSGVFGFFPGSPIPFDPTLFQGADYDAQFRILRDNNRYEVLRHWGVVWNMIIDKKSYTDGEKRDRTLLLKKIVDESDGMARLNNHTSNGNRGDEKEDKGTSLRFTRPREFNAKDAARRRLFGY